MTMPMPAPSNTARKRISLSRNAAAAAICCEISRKVTTAPVCSPSTSSGDEVHWAKKLVPS